MTSSSWAASRLGLVACAIVLLFLAGSPALVGMAGGNAQTVEEPVSLCAGDAPYAEIDADGSPRLWLEIVATPEARQRGLMGREWLDPDAGMLFQFETVGRGGFWMRDTPLPLSIAWLDVDGTIVDIQDMHPLSDDIHTPVAPYLYAMETNQGWFAANGVNVGNRVTFCIPENTPE